LHPIEVSRGNRQPTKCHPRKYGTEKEEKKKEKGKEKHILYSILNIHINIYAFISF
jgi:hypothetical protein